MATISIGSRIHKSPFYEATVEAGVASFTIYNRMYMPTSYGDPIGEYERLKTGVSCWDVAAERQVEIAGPDATVLADYVSARRLHDLEPGRARYAPMCDFRGCLINDPIALRLGPDRWWLSLADSGMEFWVHAIAGARGLDAQVFEPDVSPLAVQGPLAADVCRDLFGPEVIDPLGFFHHREVELDGIPMVICRSGWSRQGGFELFLTDGSRGIELWDRVMAAGAPYGIAPGAPHPMERIENGLLSYRSDTDDDTDPIEAGPGRYLDLDPDHDFLGNDALPARPPDPTTRRLLVNIDIEGPMPVPEHPWPASRAGTTIGEVRTATWSPQQERNIGLALVQTGHAEPGTVLDIDAAGTDLTATISAVAFGDSL